jgi:replication factor A3
MESVSTPRISAKHLQSYVGRNIMIVGKVVQVRGDTASIEMLDGNITVNLTRVSLTAPATPPPPTALVF